MRQLSPDAMTSSACVELPWAINCSTGLFNLDRFFLFKNSACIGPQSVCKGQTEDIWPILSRCQLILISGECWHLPAQCCSFPFYRSGTGEGTGIHELGSLEHSSLGTKIWLLYHLSKPTSLVRLGHWGNCSLDQPSRDMCLRVPVKMEFICLWLGLVASL